MWKTSQNHFNSVSLHRLPSLMLNLRNSSLYWRQLSVPILLHPVLRHHLLQGMRTSNFLGRLFHQPRHPPPANPRDRLLAHTAALCLLYHQREANTVLKYTKRYSPKILNSVICTAPLSRAGKLQNRSSGKGVRSVVSFSAYSPSFTNHELT